MTGVNKVTVRGVDGSHRDYGLSAGSIAIGRDPASHIHLKDSQVSWKHSLVTASVAATPVRDAGSRTWTSSSAT